MNHLFEGNETRRVGSTDTGSTVLDGVVRDRELSQVVTDHLWLNLNGVEFLSGVDANDTADHLWDDDHITEVCLDDIWLLVGLCFLLGLAELLDQTHGLALETTVEPTASAGVDDIAELVRREVEELLEVDSAVGKLAEGSLLLDLGSLFCVIFVSHACGRMGCGVVVENFGDGEFSMVLPKVGVGKGRGSKWRR